MTNGVSDVRIDSHVNVIGFENISLTVEVVSSFSTHSAFLKMLADLWFRINLLRLRLNRSISAPIHPHNLSKTDSLTPSSTKYPRVKIRMFLKFLIQIIQLETQRRIID
jgi:hypothetical protein